MAGTKTKDNSQWGRVASDGGAAVPPSVVALPNGDGREPLVDAYGRPWVHVVDPANPSGTPVNFRGFINAFFVDVEAGPVVEFKDCFAWVTNPADTPCYLQLFNQAAGPPVGSVNLEYSIPILGARLAVSYHASLTTVFTSGIVAALSSNPEGYVPVSGEPWFLAVNYEV